MFIVTIKARRPNGDKIIGLYSLYEDARQGLSGLLRQFIEEHRDVSSCTISKVRGQA
jgi:hypothetical protein